MRGRAPFGSSQTPGQPRQPARPGESEVAEGVDDQLLDGVDVAGNGVVAHGHRDDRVADQLARAVVGDVAAPIRLDQFGAELGRIHQHVAELGAQSHGVDGVVLQQQQPVIAAAGLGQRPLEGEGVGVTDPTQPTNPQGHSSADQSLVSRISLTSAMKAEA